MAMVSALLTWFLRVAEVLSVDALPDGHVAAAIGQGDVAVVEIPVIARAGGVVAGFVDQHLLHGFVVGELGVARDTPISGSPLRSP